MPASHSPSPSADITDASSPRYRGVGASARGQPGPLPTLRLGTLLRVHRQFYDAAIVMVNAGGMRVEQIQLQTSPSRPPRSYLRAPDAPYVVAYRASVDEVTQFGQRQRRRCQDARPCRPRRGPTNARRASLCCSSPGLMEARQSRGVRSCQLSRADMVNNSAMPPIGASSAT